MRVFISLFLIYLTSALDLDKFFPHGDSAGDTILVDLSKNIGVDKNDDHTFTVTTKHIPFEYIKEQTKILLNTNGYIGFGKNVGYIGSVPFPLPNPQISVYQTDLIFTDNYKSKFSYQEHNGKNKIMTPSNGLVEAGTYVRLELNKYLNKDFLPTRVFVVTWTYADHFNGGLQDFLTVQAVLATDETYTYLMLHYNELRLSNFFPTSIGWQGAHNIYFQHKNSQFQSSSENRPPKMATESNVGEPGKWIYLVGKPLGKVGPTAPPVVITPLKCPYASSYLTTMCGSKPPGTYILSAPWYIVCENGHPGRCLSCATNKQYYNEICGQCLNIGTTDCQLATSTTPATPAKALPACQRNAKDFCFLRPPGWYPNNDDNSMMTFYWCYSIGASCMPCAPGTKFCLTSIEGAIHGRCLTA